VTDPKVGDPSAYVKRLAEVIADRRITMEVCITSNLQTNPSIGTAQAHTLRKMLDNRLSVTICTDNRLVSHTTMTDELSLAVRDIGVTHRELRDIIIHGFKRGFFPGGYLEKRAYVRKAIDTFDATMRRFAEAEAAGG
jgi:adenosine deaminase